MAIRDKLRLCVVCHDSRVPLRLTATRGRSSTGFKEQGTRNKERGTRNKEVERYIYLTTPLSVDRAKLIERSLAF